MAIARVGGWGLYASVVVMLLIGLLDLVDARSDRIWRLTLRLSQLAGAWAGSWTIVILVAVARRLPGMSGK